MSTTIRPLDEIFRLRTDLERFDREVASLEASVEQNASSASRIALVAVRTGQAVTHQALEFWSYRYLVESVRPG